MNNKFEALKDDDSGSGTEDNIAPTNEENEMYKKVVPGPDEHQLQYTYCFWFSKKPPGRDDPANFEKSVRVIATFVTVEQFWRSYSHMMRPGDMSGSCDIHVFKQGIKPLWEDEANRNGGKWLVRLRKRFTSRCWEDLILAILGEQFMVGDEICGAVVSMRFPEDIISLWNRNANDSQVTSRIRDTLRRVMNLPANTRIEYKKHDDSLKDRRSFRKTKLYMR